MDTTLNTTTMTAWVQDRYGPAHSCTLRTVEVPTPGKGEVLLKVRATGLNAGDIRVMQGDPYLVRLAFGLRRPRIAMRGMDVAGTVVMVGEEVDEALLGTQVVCELPGGGGLAEYAVAPLARLVPRDPGIDPVLAAALPIAGGTAWQALERAGGVTPGQRVLVVGASGGVGTFTVQLAREAGAEVWALCGEGNRPLVEGLGAARTFDRRATSVRDLPVGEFDVIVDIAGSAPLADLQRCLAPGGAAVLVAGQGGPVLGPIGRILQAAVRSIGSRRPLRALAARPRPEVLSELLDRVADGRISPVIERTWPLSQAGQALAHVEAGHTVGKVVVTTD